MERVTSFGRADALKVNGKLKVPMVILCENNGGKDSFVGFVPGLVFNLVRANNLAECEKLLKDATLFAIKKMVKENLAFPFFPQKEEIKKDFKNVKKIIYLNISSQSKKQ